jgi:hypothetical protein
LAGAGVHERLLAGHPQIGESRRDHEHRPVEAHSAVDQHAVVARDEVGHKSPQGLQLLQIGQVLVQDREVDVEDRVGRLGKAGVHVAIHVDDGVDAAGAQRGPVVDLTGDEQGLLGVEGRHVHDVQVFFVSFLK